MAHRDFERTLLIFFLVSFSSLVSSQSEQFSSDPEFECTNRQNGRYAHPILNCTSAYFACFRGATIRLICPSTDIFDPVQGFCQPASDVPACGGQRNFTADCVNLISGNYSLNNETCLSFFLQCNNGSGVFQACPDEQFFNPTSGSCSSPDNIDACVNAGNGDETTVIPAEFNCTGRMDGGYQPAQLECLPAYYNCSNGTAERSICEDGLVFNSLTGNCTEVSQVGICEEVLNSTSICGNLTDGAYSLSSDFCTPFFIQCENGSAFLEMCPDGLYVDPMTNGCRRPEDVQLCVSGESTTQTSTVQPSGMQTSSSTTSTIRIPIGLGRTTTTSASQSMPVGPRDESADPSSSVEAQSTTASTEEQTSSSESNSTAVLSTSSGSEETSEMSTMSGTENATESEGVTTSEPESNTTSSGETAASSTEVNATSSEEVSTTEPGSNGTSSESESSVTSEGQTTSSEPEGNVTSTAETSTSESGATVSVRALMRQADAGATVTSSQETTMSGSEGNATSTEQMSTSESVGNETSSGSEGTQTTGASGETTSSGPEGNVTSSEEMSTSGSAGNETTVGQVTTSASEGNVSSSEQMTTASGSQGNVTSSSSGEMSTSGSEESQSTGSANSTISGEMTTSGPQADVTSGGSSGNVTSSQEMTTSASEANVTSSGQTATGSSEGNITSGESMSSTVSSEGSQSTASANSTASGEVTTSRAEGNVTSSGEMTTSGPQADVTANVTSSGEVTTSGSQANVTSSGEMTSSATEGSQSTGGGANLTVSSEVTTSGAEGNATSGTEMTTSGTEGNATSSEAMTSTGSAGNVTSSEEMTTSGSGNVSSTEQMTTSGSGGNVTSSQEMTTSGSGGNVTSSEEVTTSGSGGNVTTSEEMTTSGLEGNMTSSGEMSTSSSEGNETAGGYPTAPGEVTTSGAEGNATASGQMSTSGLTGNVTSSEEVTTSGPEGNVTSSEELTASSSEGNGTVSGETTTSGSEGNETTVTGLTSASTESSSAADRIFRYDSAGRVVDVLYRQSSDTNGQMNASSTVSQEGSSGLPSTSASEGISTPCAENGTGITVPPFEFNCTDREDGYFQPSELLCSPAYYNCSNGTATRLLCSDDLIFNPTTQNCTDAAQANECESAYNSTTVCQNMTDGSYAIDNSTCLPFYIACENETASFLVCHRRLYFDPVGRNCTSPREIDVCANATMENSTSSGNASDAGGRNLPLQSRFGNLRGWESDGDFLAKMNFTPVYPFEFDCQNREDGSFQPPELECSPSFYVCQNQQTYRLICPEGLFYNNATGNCTEPSQLANCQESINYTDVCAGMADGFFALKNSCSPFFIECNNGSGSFGICSWELYFDPSTSSCTIPEQIEICRFNSSIPPEAQFNCTNMPDGNYSNPLYNCSSFYYSCNGGQTSREQCPFRLFFDPVYLQCAPFDDIYECANSTSNGFYSFPSKMTDNNTRRSVEGFTLGGGSINCDGLENDNYPDPTNKCSNIFYTCTNGIAVMRKCASGTFYDSDLDVCDLFNRVPSCSNGDRPTTPSRSTSSQARTTIAFDCSGLPDGNWAAGDCEPFYFACVGGFAFKQPCPAKTFYDSITDQCNFKFFIRQCGTGGSKGAKTRRPNLPPFINCTNVPNGNYADAQNNCTNYYFVCNNGSTAVFYCAEGMFYNPNAQQCDMKQMVPGCGGGAIEANPTERTTPGIVSIGRSLNVRRNKKGRRRAYRTSRRRRVEETN
ncbi:chitin binding Peritrophin-A domain protein [Trichuris suis]|nr:chitin binding Peritrophin-A domain protein [Trichuris suis]